MIKRKKDPFSVQLGERIRVFRKMSCLTQEQLAEKALVSANFIGSVERGEYGASMNTLRRIAKALGVEVRALVDFPSREQSEILSDIMTLLKRTKWEIEELRDIQTIIRRFARR